MSGTMTTRRARLDFALLIMALAAFASVGMAPPEPGELTEATETFKSRGQDVVVDVIAPKDPGRHPAVVVLHGHGGLGEGRRSGTHSLARRLAGSGYVALVPHYFGSRKPDRKNGQKNARSFAFWERTVSDTVGFAVRRSDVDPKRIGLLGASLGSWVALSVGRAIAGCQPWSSITAGSPNGRSSIRPVCHRCWSSTATPIATSRCARRITSSGCSWRPASPMKCTFIRVRAMDFEAPITTTPSSARWTFSTRTSSASRRANRKAKPKQWENPRGATAKNLALGQ